MRTDRFVLCFGLLAVGCGRASVPTVAPPPATPLTIVKPEKRTVRRVIELPGSIHAFEETELFAKIPGFIRTIAADPNKANRPPHDRLMDIGSHVKAGQVLAELSVPELDEEFQQKEALVRQTDAEVVQAKQAVTAAAAGVAAAQAMVVEAKAGLGRTQALYERWESESARVARLVKDGVIDSQTRDETVNQLKAAESARAESLAKVASAEAAVAKSAADRDKASADVAAVEAKRDVAKADARRVDALRDYTRIRAPYDGAITRRAANTGDLIPADGKRGLFTIARTDPVRAVVHVPESDAGLVAVGQEMSLVLQGVAPSGVKVTVTRTSWSLTPGSRTLRVEVDLPNPDARIRPGTYVAARLALDMPPTWSVPAAAVVRANDEAMIFLVEKGHAVRVSVQLLRGDDQFTQVARYRRPGANTWTDFTGEEQLATPAGAAADGQAVP